MLLKILSHFIDVNRINRKFGIQLTSVDFIKIVSCMVNNVLVTDIVLNKVIVKSLLSVIVKIMWLCWDIILGQLVCFHEKTGIMNIKKKDLDKLLEFLEGITKAEALSNGFVSEPFILA